MVPGIWLFYSITLLSVKQQKINNLRNGEVLKPKRALFFPNQVRQELKESAAEIAMRNVDLRLL